MVNLTVRNIPESLLKYVRFYATGSRRSVNSEILVLLEESLDARSRESVSDRPSGFSAGSRALLWNELCGAWEDEADITRRINSIYRMRDGRIQEDHDGSF